MSLGWSALIVRRLVPFPSDLQDLPLLTTS